MPVGVRLTYISVQTSVGPNNVGGNFGEVVAVPQFVGSEDIATNVPALYVFSQNVLAFAEGPNAVEVLADRTPSAIAAGQPQGKVTLTISGYLIDLAP